MKTAFITFEKFHGRKDIGSSRIRAHNLIKYWEKAGTDIGPAYDYQYGGKYDVLIFQKAYFAQMAENFQGIKILDLCDADWLYWGYKIKETLQHCDAVTCPTLAIAKYIVNLTDKPVVVIPDRVDFDTIPDRIKNHIGDIRKVVWFGYADNFEVLNMAVPAIYSRGLELIVISNKSYIPPRQFKELEITNYPWSPDHWMDDMIRGDIVINPKYEKGRFKFKSDNKTTQAWALGIPVAYVDIDLDSFKTEDTRKKEAEEKLILVKKNFDVKKSVIELKELIIEIYENKNKHKALNG